MSWFADDANVVGSLSKLLSWWQHLSSTGPGYGYFTNAARTVLIVKPGHLFTAKVIFANSSIQITAHGQWRLDAALGTREFAEEYVTAKVITCTAKVSALAKVANIQSHPAYCAFTHGKIGCWIYLMRTIPNISINTIPNIIIIFHYCTPLIRSKGTDQRLFCCIYKVEN